MVSLTSVRRWLCTRVSLTSPISGGLTSGSLTYLLGKSVGVSKCRLKNSASDGTSMLFSFMGSNLFHYCTVGSTSETSKTILFGRNIPPLNSWDDGGIRLFESMKRGFHLKSKSMDLCVGFGVGTRSTSTRNSFRGARSLRSTSRH